MPKTTADSAPKAPKDKKEKLQGVQKTTAKAKSVKNDTPKKKKAGLTQAAREKYASMKVEDLVNVIDNMTKDLRNLKDEVKSLKSQAATLTDLYENSVRASK